MKKIILAFLFLIAVQAYAQQKDSVVVEINADNVKMVNTIQANARVIGILEGSTKLAVLQIISADENNCGLKKGEEILVQFYFGTKPVAGELNLEGIAAGDKIMGELFCKENVNTIQKDYTVMRYIILEKNSKE